MARQHLARLTVLLALLPGINPGVGRAETIHLVPVADTTLHEAIATNNFGGGASFTSGYRLQGGRSRALLQFDIAGALPAGATINSAELQLAVMAVNGPGSNFQLHRMLVSWGEGDGADIGLGTLGTAGQATWKVRLGPGSPWTTPGGDFAADASASQAMNAAGSYTLSSAALASDVQSWLDAPAQNLGWLLKSEDEVTAGTIRRFAGRLSQSDPPLLVINYSVPGSPQPAAPVLTDLALMDAGIRFTFLAQSNRTYTVQFRDALTGGDWAALTTFPALPADAPVHVTNSPMKRERYFRVRTP